METATSFSASWVLFALFSLLLGCEFEQPAEYSPEFSDISPLETTEYIFGVHPLHNPQRLHEVFGPLMRYLSAKIPQTQFRLEASRNYAAYDAKLYAKKFDFALSNPFQTINAESKGYKIVAKMGDDDNFHGIILVRKDSKIKKISDLVGRAVSYPAPTALAATMMPQYFMQQHGLSVMRDLDNRYVGSQESSILNIYLGEVAAAATSPPPWHALSEERPELKEALTVKWRTKPLPNNGIVALPDIPARVKNAVVNNLISLHKTPEGRTILERMKLSKFESANSKTYQPVRDFVVRFNKEVAIE